MYTILLPGRSHIVSNEAAKSIVDAIEDGRRLVTIEVEMNGEGSRPWNIILNVAQVIALVEQPLSRDRRQPALTLVGSEFSD